jgi:Spy/CpxP family protein refolding chaperone
MSLAAVFLVATMATAQQGGKEYGKGGEERLAKMTEQLALSPEQVASIKRIHEEHSTKLDALRATAESEQRNTAMKELRKSERKAVQDVLTPEQRTKAEALREERKAARASGHEQKDPAERAAARTAWMTKELGLTAEQAQKVEAIQLQHLTKMQEVKGITDEAQRKSAMKEIRKSQKAAMQAVLTKEQQARLKELAEERKAAKGASGEPKERSAPKEIR